MIRSPWVLGHRYDSTAYEPVGWSESAGGIVCTDPTRRGDLGHVTYGATMFDDAPTYEAPGKAYVGIGCAWVETGTTEVAVSVDWTGKSSITNNEHVEAAPLLHVTPGTTEHGIGVWPSVLIVTGPNKEPAAEGPILYLGTLGNPPEEFNVLQVISFPGGQTPGTPRTVTLTSDGAQVQVSVDGVDAGDPEDIPANLLGSTLHGYAIDTHLVDTGGTNGADDWDGTIPTIPAMTGITIEDLS